MMRIKAINYNMRPIFLPYTPDDMEGHSTLGPDPQELKEAENDCLFLFISLFRFSFTSQNFSNTFTLGL